MRSPEEAGAYVRKLRAILRYVGSCDGNMEQGSMRADVNVSVRKPGDEFGTRTETKNVNSVRFIMAVIEHEARRQVDLIEEGGTIVQETRLFDPDNGETRSLRSKEDAHDYRYFPDPDLLPLELTTRSSANAARACPSCPTPSARRYEGELGLSRLQRRGADRRRRPPRAGSRRCWPRYRQSRRRDRQGRGQLGDLGPVRRAQPARQGHRATARSAPPRPPSCSRLIADGTLSGTLAKQVFEIMLETGDDPDAIVEERGLKQTSDTGAIEAVIAEVMAANADKVAEYRGGKDKLFGFFVGQMMKAMAGKANPGVVNELLKKALGCG